MALQISVPVRNARLDAIETITGPSARLRFFTGAPPANCAAAATGTELANLALPADYFTDGAAGVKAKQGVWSGTAIGTGAFGYFRFYDTTGTTCTAQGTCATAAADMIVDAASVTTGQTFTVTSFSFTDANA